MQSLLGHVRDELLEDRRVLLVGCSGPSCAVLCLVIFHYENRERGFHTDASKWADYVEAVQSGIGVSAPGPISTTTNDLLLHVMADPTNHISFDSRVVRSFVGRACYWVHHGYTIDE